MTVALALLGAPAAAQPRCPPEAPLAVGQASMTWLGFAVYDASLCAAPSFVPRQFERSTFMLELAYRRALRSAEIARRSIEEMRRAGDFDDVTAARWETALRTLLPDVREGDRLAGVNRPGRGASFYFNGRWLGEIADAEFARLFFAIWLAPTTSEPALRARLLEGAAR